jgi:hypothetical protein
MVTIVNAFFSCYSQLTLSINSTDMQDKQCDLPQGAPTAEPQCMLILSMGADCIGKVHAHKCSLHDTRPQIPDNYTFP